MNDFFVCECCNNLDSIHATQQLSPGFKCHRCINGEWHNAFPERKYDPDVDHQVINRVGGNGPSFG